MTPITDAAPQAPPVSSDSPKQAPVVAVKANGRIGKTVEGVNAQYRSAHPDRHVRWVYHSATKPELSNLMSRNVDGYRIVTIDEFPDQSLIIPFIDEKGLIRIADTVLMSIPEEQWKANRAERRQVADDQLSSVKDKFDASMDTATQGRHRAIARGAAQLEQRDHEYNIEQRSSQE